MNPMEVVWKHPRQAYELAYVLKNDQTQAYEQYAAALRENIVSLEDRISQMQAQIDELNTAVFSSPDTLQEQIDILWAEVFP
jgi:hypothetical protein